MDRTHAHGGRGKMAPAGEFGVTLLNSTGNVLGECGAEAEDAFFHSASACLLLAYSAPNTRLGQLFMHSGLVVGFLVISTWAWNIIWYGTARTGIWSSSGGAVLQKKPVIYLG